MSGRIRPPAVAGLFYPAEPAELAATVDDLLAAADGRSDRAPHAVVVPHAGYLYSGAVAAVAYRAVKERAAEIRQVVLFGPPHFIPLQGAAVPAADAWATPLGIVPVADGLRVAALGAGAVVDDVPHAPEHSLEVQLPFLQRVLQHEFSVLPVVVGEMPTRAAADLVAALWGGSDTLVVVSTDLSHYLDDGAARVFDRTTSEAIAGLRPEAIGDRAACGYRALRGFVEHARRAGLTIEILALATSADASGDRSRVVGYGAFAAAAGKQQRESP
jgi:AmmeMemoRadiSam system protein B